jgi:hypothetical protein
MDKSPLLWLITDTIVLFVVIIQWFLLILHPNYLNYFLYEIQFFNVDASCWGSFIYSMWQ